MLSFKKFQALTESELLELFGFGKDKPDNVDTHKLASEYMKRREANAKLKHKPRPATRTVTPKWTDDPDEVLDRASRR